MIAGAPTLAELERIGATRAAAFWLERLQHDEQEGDDALFRSWLSASPANSAAWDDALDLWDSFDSADEEDTLEEMRHEALAFRRPRLPISWIGYAAAGSVAAAAAVVLMFDFGSVGGGRGTTEIATLDRPDLKSFGPADYQTGTGQRGAIALEDGSKVTLDTNSAIDVAYQGDKRLVRLLRGQAFFDVKHDSGRPFRVAAGERIVTVLGTRFNVRVESSETKVVLVQGSIGISAGSDPSKPGAEIERLSPGEQLIAHAGEADAIRKVETTPSLEWQRGFVQFDRQTLAAAITELNRYTDKKLVIRDPWVAALKISGAFPTGDNQRFIQTLSALYPVRAVTMADGNIEIVRRR